MIIVAERKGEPMDLIERAAAQTELMMKCERYTLARESHGMGHVEWSSDLISVADAMDAIRGLPSAQPERAIKDCRNCKFGDYNDHWNTNFCYCSGNCNNWDKWEPSAQPDTYEALRILDAINSSGRLDYGDYCDLHDAISEIGGAQNG